MEGKNKPNIVRMIAKRDNSKKNSSLSKRPSFSDRLRSFSNSSMEQINQISKQYQIIYLTEKHDLFCMNERG